MHCATRPTSLAPSYRRAAPLNLPTPCRHAPQTNYNELMSDPSYIDGCLSRGADVANETAAQTLANVKDAMGFVPPFKKQ